MADSTVKRVLIADDDPAILLLLTDILKREEAELTTVQDGAAALEKLSAQHYDLLLCDVRMPVLSGIELLEKMQNITDAPPVIIMTADDTPNTLLSAIRNKALNVVSKPFKATDMLDMVRAALAAPLANPIEVISARPDWVELLVPCELRSADRIQNILFKLKADLSEDVRESVGQAFRELLMNAIEWGGKLDASRQVRISYQRFKKFLLYRIADPGQGFNFEGLAHAAVSNAPDDPIGHMRIREEQGIRPGGLGILMTQSLVDELLYNEAQNEVVFVKYLE
jgi:CheY-like chemotaxis protein/anti-sigma regulatory factor (Ser/Thr protein kinase)